MNKEKRNMNQVAKKKDSNIALAGMFEADSMGGMEQMSTDDFAMPFLRVLSQLSPETNKRDSKYVEGAEPGMIFNTVTKQAYDGEKGINVVPCFYKREYVEWQDRGEGTGAPVAIHSVESGIIKEATRDGLGKDRLSNGNYLENTASYFVMTEDLQQALITMKATQLKVSRTWNSMMNTLKLKGKNGLFTPASYSHVYNLSTVQQSNDKGTWFGWNVAMIGPVQDENLYGAAKAFASSMRNVEVKHDKDEPAASKEDVPF